MPLNIMQKFRKLIRNLRTQNVPEIAKIQKPERRWPLKANDIRVGQIFRDNDGPGRVKNRYLIVMSIDGVARKAHVRRYKDSSCIHEPFVRTRISLTRLASSAYSLIQGVDQEQATVA